MTPDGWSKPTLSRAGARPPEVDEAEPTVALPDLAAPIARDPVRDESPAEPDVADADAEAPEADVPEADVPEADVPEAEVPEADVPEAEIGPPEPEAGPAEADVAPPESEAGPAEADVADADRPAPVFTSVPIAADLYPAPRRARTEYETGSVEAGHGELLERAADVAVSAMPIPLRVLDVGCGDGVLLEELFTRVPYAELYVGVDPAPDLEPAMLRAPDPHLTFVRAAAEALPFADASFDLVVATASFAYWVDQREGAKELARVVSDNGKVVVVESVHSSSKRKRQARSDKEIAELLTAAGLVVERTETIRRSKVGRSTARAFIASP